MEEAGIAAEVLFNMCHYRTDDGVIGSLPPDDLLDALICVRRHPGSGIRLMGQVIAAVHAVTLW